MKYLEFSARLRQACRDAHLPETQHEIAKIFGVSAPMISYYMTGAKLPSMDTAILMAQKTGVCVEWLLTGRGVKTPQEPPSASDWLDLRGLDQGVKRALQAAALASRTPNGKPN